MPVSLAPTSTTNTYPVPGSGGAQIAGTDEFAQGFFIVANAGAVCQFNYGLQGQWQGSPDIFLAPGTYPLQGFAAKPISGIRFRSAVSGTPAVVWGAFFYPNEPSLEASGEFLSTVTASGGVTPPISTQMNVQAVQAGNKAPGQTYTLTVSTSGTYIIEWGCAGYSQSGLGDSGTISCSDSAVVNFHGSTAGSGGDALDTGIVLAAGHVITFTVGGGMTSFNGCWAKITQIA